MNALDKNNLQAKFKNTGQRERTTFKGMEDSGLQNYGMLMPETKKEPTFQPPQRRPMKIYDRNGDTLTEEDQSFNPEMSLNAESKFMAVDGNTLKASKGEELFNPSASIQSTTKFVPVSDNNYNSIQSSKVIDTFEFLDKIGGNLGPSKDPKRYTEERKAPPKIKKKESNDGYGIQLDRNSGFPSLPDYQYNKYGVGSNTLQSNYSNAPQTLETINSLKLDQINKMNSKRLNDLNNIGGNTMNSNPDELDKLDKLLLDLANEPKHRNYPIEESKSNSRRSVRAKESINKFRMPPLDSINEQNNEGTVKGESMKFYNENPKTMESHDFNNLDLELPTLK